MWEAIKNWCMDSETIAYFRAQVLGGIVFLVDGIASADWPLMLTQIQNGEIPDLNRMLQLGVYIIATGLLGEYLRRRRDPGLKRAAK